MAWSALHGTDGSVVVYRQTDGVDSPGGTFTLAFNGETSKPLPWNASAEALEQALESLEEVGDVSVTATYPARGATGGENSSTASATWTVEFTTLGTPANIGDLPLLEADGSFLTGSTVGVTVEEMSAGCCAVEISANGGADFSSTGSYSESLLPPVAAFRYQDRAMVRSVTPSAGPTSGGTEVLVSGTGFDLPSALIASEDQNGDFVCVFGGRIESPATRINSSAVTCASPFTSRLESGAMSVAVRWPGSVSSSTTTAAFTYFDDVTLQALTPRRGSNAGGFATFVSIGRGSFSAVGVVEVTCAIELRIPSNLTGGSATLNFSAPATAELPSTVLEGKETYSCYVPGLDGLFPGISAEDWMGHDWGAIALVSLSGNNGADLTAPLIFTYFPRPVVASALPGLGVDSGGTSVMVHGTWFAPPEGGYDDSELLCRFGNTAPVPAQYVLDGALACISPPHTNVAAVMSVAVESARVFHATHEVLVRIPSPTGGQINASSGYSGLGTWTVSLEDYETYPLGANVTSDEMAVALSSLPSVGRATVTAEYRSISDPYAGLTWNETLFTVYFAARGGALPVLTVNSSDLREKSSEEIAVDGFVENVFGFPLLAPEISARTVEGGHDGDGIVREVQVLRTYRSKILPEVQTLTVMTGMPPTAEVRAAGWFFWPFPSVEKNPQIKYRCHLLGSLSYIVNVCTRDGSAAKILPTNLPLNTRSKSSPWRQMKPSRASSR